MFCIIPGFAVRCWIASCWIFSFFKCFLAGFCVFLVNVFLDFEAGKETTPIQLKFQNYKCKPQSAHVRLPQGFFKLPQTQNFGKSDQKHWRQGIRMLRGGETNPKFRYPYKIRFSGRRSFDFQPPFKIRNVGAYLRTIRTCVRTVGVISTIKNIQGAACATCWNSVPLLLKFIVFWNRLASFLQLLVEILFFLVEFVVFLVNTFLAFRAGKETTSIA